MALPSGFGGSRTSPALYIGENMLYSNNDLRKLILPLIIEQALAILVGMVDSINVLMINVLSALATGGSCTSPCPTAWKAACFSWESC